MSYDKRVEKKVVSDFAKALSCSYSVTLNLGRVLGVGDDDLLLRSVVGFSSGVATMGDTFTRKWSSGPKTRSTPSMPALAASPLR